MKTICDVARDEEADEQERPQVVRGRTSPRSPCARRDDERDEERDRRDDDRTDLGVAAADERRANSDGQQAEADAGEHAEEDREHVLGSHSGRTARRVNVRLAVAGGCAAGLASGWNIGNIGAVATQLGTSYGVGLATVGLFTTALFVTHLLLQVPAGRASDRYGERRVALVGLAIIVCFNALALIGP